MSKQVVCVYCRVATKEQLSQEVQETEPELPANKKAECPQRILKSYKDTPHGPSDRIRTCGILLPKQARYQLRYTRI